MIVGNFNATDDQLWKWFRIPGTDGELELKLITRDELTALGKNPDLSMQARYIAKNFFRDIRNLKDRNGVDIPNDEDNRVLLLNVSRVLWSFVTLKLTDLSAWFDEGKGDSGSAF